MTNYIKIAKKLWKAGEQIYDYLQKDYNEHQALVEDFRVVVRGEGLGKISFRNERFEMNPRGMDETEVICRAAPLREKLWNGTSVFKNRKDHKNVGSAPHDYGHEYAEQIAAANGVSVHEVYMILDRVLVAVALYVAEKKGENMRRVRAELWGIRVLLRMAPRGTWSRICKAK